MNTPQSETDLSIFYDADIDTESSNYEYCEMNSRIMKIIDFNEESGKLYSHHESLFFERMKMYFLKHKLHLDLKIYFYFL